MCAVCGGRYAACPVQCRGARDDGPPPAAPARQALILAALRDPAESQRQHAAGLHRSPMPGACPVCSCQEAS